LREVTGRKAIVTFIPGSGDTIEWQRGVRLPELSLGDEAVFQSIGTF
jgi:hypothetical protein